MNQEHQDLAAAISTALGLNAGLANSPKKVFDFWLQDKPDWSLCVKIASTPHGVLYSCAVLHRQMLVRTPITGPSLQEVLERLRECDVFAGASV